MYRFSSKQFSRNERLVSTCRHSENIVAATREWEKGGSGKFEILQSRRAIRLGGEDRFLILLWLCLIFWNVFGKGTEVRRWWFHWSIDRLIACLLACLLQDESIARFNKIQTTGTECVPDWWVQKLEDAGGGKREVNGPEIRPPSDAYSWAVHRPAKPSPLRDNGTLGSSVGILGNFVQLALKGCLGCGFNCFYYVYKLENSWSSYIYISMRECSMAGVDFGGNPTLETNRWWVSEGCL